MTRMRVAQSLRALTYLLASAILLWLVWRWFDGEQAWRRLQSAHIGWLVTAWLFLTLQTIASALRWQLTCKQLGVPMAKSIAIGQYYVSMLCNFTLPGGVLGDAGRAWHHRQAAGLAASAAAVILERLAGQLAMIVTLVLALAWQLRATVASHTMWWLGVAVMSAFIVFLGRRLPGPAWLTRLTSWIHQAWFAKEARAPQLGWTVFILVASLMSFYACAQAVGVELSGNMALLVLPATLLVMALPVSVAGWGVREAGAALIWPLAGVASDAAVAASIAYGLVATISVLPGLLWVRPKLSPQPH
ncbi:flippase-like domain-containing protein [Orrella daihaiensis]|uniref:Flippase-like domain-containing protein n=2 Tax=Orrella daihaiensis TaxID=2782176 RepID=A0ABY4AQK2_9BURK|nr:flippase-like domain-containing protein [Orrella daihaiensis]